jgi:hypothetical protein
VHTTRPTHRIYGTVTMRRNDTNCSSISQFIIKPDKEKLLIESMHRFGEAIKTQQGLREVHTLRDQKSGHLIGLAVWDSKQSMLAARPIMAKATEGDDFDAWEEEEPTVFLLEET